MTNCDYCGKPNEDTCAVCVACGSAVDLAPKGEEVRIRNGPSHLLNAKTAGLVFLAWFGVQAFCGFLSVVVPGHKKPPAWNAEAVIAAFLLCAVWAVFLSYKLFPNQIRDRSPTGAAWVAGKTEGLLKGLLIGLIIGTFNEYFILATNQFVARRSMDSVGRMAYTPGVNQVTWLALVLLGAPFLEEMVFRGVLYGGCRRSFGPLWAGVITTFLFVAAHFPHFLQHPSNMVAVAIVAVAMLRARLHWKAIGPAVAIHMGYNLMDAFVTLYWQRRF